VQDGISGRHARLCEPMNLDIKMPELDGFSLYREIKSLDKGVKVCFLTAGEMYNGVPSVFMECFVLKNSHPFLRRCHMMLSYVDG
jgi:CheY-like chemotaxis protein